MLALATGWTQDVIGGGTGQVSDDFRAACHWALFAREIVGDGLPEIPQARGASREQLTQIARLANGVASARRILFPDDTDG